ncbi:hypothetical protein CLOM_g22841 [Closterium sp. NIES-68]|nr:hypothetical protein CLOM_g22841 [Closterium sp. NIES-68]GJP85720.1 hypothetical protein CLOP_g15824 [Closterium sp. NIES-67]
MAFNTCCAAGSRVAVPSTLARATATAANTASPSAIVRPPQNSMRGLALTHRGTSHGPIKPVWTNRRVARGARAAVATAPAKAIAKEESAILYKVEEFPDGTVMLRFAEAGTAAAGAAGTGSGKHAAVDVERSVVEFLLGCRTPHCRVLDNAAIDEIVGTHVPLQPAQQLSHLVTTTAHNTVTALKETLSAHSHHQQQHHHHSPATNDHPLEPVLSAITSTPAPPAVAPSAAAQKPATAPAAPAVARAAAVEHQSPTATQLAPAAAASSSSISIVTSPVAPVVLAAAVAAAVQLVAKRTGLVGKLPGNTLKAWALWSWPAAAVIVAVAAGVLVWRVTKEKASGKTLPLLS